MAANAQLDPAGMLAPFAADAVVRDEGGRHEGHGAIRAWMRSATVGSRAVFSPDAWREEDGRVVVQGLTFGDFPGSPLPFTFRFRLEGGAIDVLDIA